MDEDEITEVVMAKRMGTSCATSATTTPRSPTALLGVVSKSVTAGAGAFLLGWAALIFASALAAFITAFIIANPTLIGAFQTAAGGSAYGLFIGWVVGAVTAKAKGAGS